MIEPATVYLDQGADPAALPTHSADPSAHSQPSDLWIPDSSSHRGLHEADDIDVPENERPE